jgi:protoporphyrinogen oxidase
MSTQELLATQVVVIGAGPAGLTAAYELQRNGQKCVVLEADDVVGGISRTVERDGWRFDIGGHRFFTKVPRVEAFWHEILSGDQFMMRPRMSRIFYKKKFFDYPLKIGNALSGLGIFESIRCVLSYGYVRIRPPRNQSSFEGWTASRFGWRLYRIFFKTYTEKVWGVPADTIQADWAAQRIKNLSLFTAVVHALFPRRNGATVTSLIDEFQYPKLGPGMMWETCRDVLLEGGSRIHMSSGVSRITRDSDGAREVITDQGQVEKCTAVISSMPMGQLIHSFDPPAPDQVIAAADALSYRDFITVALVLKGESSFPDNWIYIHEPEVLVGRVQNFASWSPYMVKEGMSCLGLEYFAFEGDDLWQSSDQNLIQRGIREMSLLGLIEATDVETGYVVRMPKAYPMYDASYQANVEMIRQWISSEVPNVFPVGRNGMHRYNNQDHSMYTAMLTVDNLFGADHDVWSVNVDDDYHEEVTK